MQEILDLESFTTAINTNYYVMVDCYAPWCGPCKRIAPQLEELSEKDRFTKVKFLKVNVDDVEDFATKYKVSAMPTFLFFKYGKLVDTVVGADLKKVVETLVKLT